MALMLPSDILAIVNPFILYLLPLLHVACKECTKSAHHERREYKMLSMKGGNIKNCQQITNAEELDNATTSTSKIL
jgi:hypothetical protein